MTISNANLVLPLPVVLVLRSLVSRLYRSFLVP